MKRIIYCLPLFLVSLLPHAITSVKAEDPAIGTFIPTLCAFDLPENAVEGRDIECGYVVAPEFHGQAGSTTIRLAVAILPSTSLFPAADPLFMAQGGPGGSTLSYFVSEMTATELGRAFLAERDIVLVEQRGTRYAQPNLACEELDTLTYDNLLVTLDPATSDELTVEALHACYRRLTATGINPSAYNSIQNAHDMNLARQALGYEKINFYGVSYGTMLVQHYMRLYPEALRSVIIDAVVPLSRNFLVYYPYNAQRSFDLVFDTCNADMICPHMYPDLESVFYDRIAQLNDAPVTLDIYDRNTDAYFSAMFNGDDFMSMIFNMMYVTDFIPYVPRIIWEVEHGDYETVAYLQGFYTFNFTLARGMYYSVLCAEDADFTLADVVLDGVRAEVASNFRLSRFEPVCAVWDVEPLDTTVDDPVYSDVPTLVLSGEFDPITPPENGKIVAQTLTNAYVFTLPGVGHGAIDASCGTAIATQFLHDPSRAPDASCVYDMRLVFASPVQ